MKINYKQYPILEKLEKRSLGIIPIYKNDKTFFDSKMGEYTNNWKLFANGFSEEINVISGSFLEATAKAKPKLGMLLADIFSNDLDDFIVKGTYILGDIVIMINYETKQGSESQEIALYGFYMNGTPLFLNVMSAKHDIQEIMWISNCFNDDIGIFSEEEIIEFIKTKLGDIFAIKMFKTYASVETKILKPKQKVMEIICKYKNDTKMNLTFLDSKWFTNLVKSDSFKVRGHFRLQPKKIDGEMSKELIWISDFVKSGYTAPARILSN